MSSLFGTSGIRGHAEEFLTNQFCFDIGRTFSRFLDKHKAAGRVAIGMDPRVSSARIRNAVSAGLNFENRKVLDQGISPAPALNYILVADNSLAGSIIVTGSHVKADFNGIKFFAFGEEILKRHEKEIEEIYEELKGEIAFSNEFIKEAEKQDRANELYQKMLFDLADRPYPKWKIILDMTNGCQSKVMPKLLKNLGIEAIFLNNRPEPRHFLARDTETQDTVAELQELVKKENADLGIGFDADGDRTAFVDAKGTFIPGDYIGSLIAKHSKGNKVVTPINTSQVAEHAGKEVVRTKVGSPFVVEEMKNSNAQFGFEANGGGISKEIVMTRDGGSTMIKMLNILKHENMSLEQAVDTLPKFHIFRTKVDCPSKLNGLILEKAENAFKGIKTEKMDGLKIWTSESSWMLFRPSSNAPEFRVFTEAKTREEAEKLGQQGINFVKSLIS